MATANYAEKIEMKNKIGKSLLFFTFKIKILELIFFATFLEGKRAKLSSFGLSFLIYGFSLGSFKKV